MLARFDDSRAAIVRNYFGKGVAYAVGVSWKDVIVRNELNRDLAANRCYSNCFEPASDVFSLFLRGILMKHIPHLVWKSTAPFNSSSVLIITHDVDAESSMKRMNHFAKLENSRGITATYNITTHYVDDALDNDYYTKNRDLISRLQEQNQNIASHSVGHFPDFDKFPLGHLGNTRSNYHPRYEDGRTIGGTILGELEVSKQLLEQVVSQPVVTFRAGYLLYPDKLVNALKMLGYHFDTSRAAGDVMTSFPYRSLTNRSFNGKITDVWEIPMTISDVFKKDVAEQNFDKILSLWTKITKKYNANGAPVVLLIHPDRDIKLQLEKAFLNNLPASVTFSSIRSYGNFWRHRNKVSFRTEITGNNLNIYLQQPSSKIPDKVSFKVSNGAGLNKINVYDSRGNQLSYLTEQTKSGNVVVYNIKDQKKPHTQHGGKPFKLYTNYPNPFVNSTTISYFLNKSNYVHVAIYSILGREIQTLVDRKQQAGLHSIRFEPDNLASGVYIYTVRVNSYLKAGKMTYIK